MDSHIKEQSIYLQNEIEAIRFNLIQNECSLKDQLDKLNQLDRHSTEYEKQENNVAKLQSKINDEKKELEQKQQELNSI